MASCKVWIIFTGASSILTMALANRMYFQYICPVPVRDNIFQLSLSFVSTHCGTIEEMFFSHCQLVTL